MTSFEHFVLTPFFIRFSHNPADRDAKLRSKADWLSNRKVLFEKYCLPSVVNQTRNNFKWILFFDVDTPRDYLAQISAIIESHPNVHIEYCDLFDDIACKRAVENRMAPETEWVLTTRLDNDDGWNKRFVETLHDNMGAKERKFINFPVGFIFYRNHLYLYKHRSNAFISFLEHKDNLRTVWCGPHPYVSEIAPVHQMPTSPAFVQVVHDQTRSNKPRGVRVHRRLALPGFEDIEPLVAGAETESDLDIVFDNATSVVVWAVRDRAIRVVRSSARALLSAGMKNTPIAGLLRRAAGR